MKSLRPLFVAIQFLTRLPVRFDVAPTADEIGRSLFFYPLVGVLIGLTLVLAHWILPASSPLVDGAVLLALWVALTGALHLDGLSDTVDAYVGSHGNAERALAIMKDRYAGPMGVTAIVVLCIAKFAALSSMTTPVVALIAAPVLARTAIPVLFATTPYVRDAGLGTPLAQALTTTRAVALAMGVVALALGLFGAAALPAILTASAVTFVLRAQMLTRLGGTTGDTAGAVIECVETAVIVMLALLPP